MKKIILSLAIPVMMLLGSCSGFSEKQSSLKEQSATQLNTLNLKVQEAWINYQHAEIQLVLISKQLSAEDKVEFEKLNEAVREAIRTTSPGEGPRLSDATIKSFNKFTYFVKQISAAEQQVKLAKIEFEQVVSELNAAKNKAKEIII